METKRTDRDLEIIQNLLEPDERLLWWDYPKLRYMRKPLQLVDVLLLALLGFVFACLLLLAIHVLLKKPLSPGKNIGMFLLFWAILFLLTALNSWLRTFTAVLKAGLPYRKYTLYALTGRRALIIIAFPGAKPVVLAYPPDEIGQPAGIIRHDGSGTVTFAAPRKLKPVRFGMTVTLPGSFAGISSVQRVIELLLELKEQNKNDVEQS